MATVGTVNQRQIAERLRLSRTTVSRCFSNHPGINPETRARVFSLAAELGYHHMEPRSRGRKKRSSRVGVLIATAVGGAEGTAVGPDPAGHAMLTGISEGALLHGINLEIHHVIATGGKLVETRSFQPLGMRRNQWSGVLLIHPFPDPIVKGLIKKFPCVSLLHRYPESAQHDCIDADSRTGIGHIVDRLVELGHRKIGFFAGPSTHGGTAGAPWVLHRFSAYVEQLARHGIAFDPSGVINVHPGDQFLDPGPAADRLLLLRANGVTAWVCATDSDAYSLIDTLSKRGVAVPSDLSVTGFGGAGPPVTPGAPALTTVRVPYDELGIIALRRIGELVQKRFTPAQHILVEPAMVHGESSAPPPPPPPPSPRRSH